MTIVSLLSHINGMAVILLVNLKCDDHCVRHNV